MANTMPRSMRIPEDLWTAAVAHAAAREETVTEVVVRALTRYVETTKAAPARRAGK